MHQHPQVKQVLEINHPWVFTCAKCGADFYLRGSHTQPDGSLVCWSCIDDDDRRSNRIWCPGCKRALPREQFIYVPPEDPDTEDGQRILALRAMFTRPGYIEYETLCEECRAKPKPTTICAKCGQAFTPRRSDAKFCSGRCRVAAHRAGSAGQ